FTYVFFFSSRRRHTRSYGDWSSDVCSSDLEDRNPVSATHAAMQHRGVRRGDRVAIFLDNSVESVVSVYGTLKIGAVFMPVNALKIGRASCRERGEVAGGGVGVVEKDEYGQG